MPVAVLEGIDERIDRRFPDHLERLDRLSPPILLPVTELAKQPHDRRRSDHAERPRRTHLDRGVGVVERPDQRFDRVGPKLRYRGPLLFCDQVADSLPFGLRHPADPAEGLRGTQPDTVTLIEERPRESGDGRPADPDERIDGLQPDGVVWMPQCLDERPDDRVTETDEHGPGPLPDQGIVVPERPDQRADGGLLHRPENLRRSLPGTGVPESPDERAGGRTPDPDQHSGGRPAERLLAQGPDQGIDGRLPYPDQRLACGPQAGLVAEQADQGRSRNGPEADKRFRRPRPHPRILIAEPRRQGVDSGGTESRDLRPLLQRDQVRGLFFHPGGGPAEPPEDHRGPHPGPAVLIAERFDKRLPRGVTDPGERSLRPRVPVAVFAKEGNESVYRGRTDADQGVDGLPVEAVAAAPDEFDDGRDRLVCTEPAQDLDGVLPDGAAPPFEQGENRGDGRSPDGNERVRCRRGDGAIAKGVYERPYSRGETDLAECRRSLAAYTVVVAVERPDQGNDRRRAHQGKFYPLFPGDEVPGPLGVVPGLPAHPVKDVGGMTTDPGPAGRQRLDQGRGRRLPERTEDFPERLERPPVRIVQGLNARFRRRLPDPEQGGRRRAAERGVGEQPDE